MCVVSMVMDDWSDRWKRQYPWFPQNPVPAASPNSLPIPTVPYSVGPTKEEFDQLKKEVEILKEQILRAKEYDKRNNEPDCELEEKVALIKRVAELVGVDLKDVLK